METALDLRQTSLAYLETNSSVKPCQAYPVCHCGFEADHEQGVLPASSVQTRLLLLASLAV